MAKKLAENLFLPLLASLSLAGLIFVTPSNLFFKFDQFDWSIRGLQVDYLLPKIYLSDLAAAISIVILTYWKEKSIKIQNIKTTKLEIFGLLIGLGFFVRQIFTPFPAAAISEILRLSLILWLGILGHFFWAKLNQKILWWALVTTNIFQACLGIRQFFTQKSLATYSTLLGETDLSSFAGIAFGNFGRWGEKILPYGTTAHPNILAGWLTGSWLLAIYWSQKSDLHRFWQVKIISLISGLLTLEIIFLSQSWSAAGFLTLGLIWIYGLKLKTEFLTLKRWHLGIILSCLMLSYWWLNFATTHLKLTNFFNQNLGWSRRESLLTAAQEITQKNWLWGTGLNQFSVYLETVNHPKELVRFVQPVHHVGWLWLSETGLLGLVAIALLGYKIQKHQPRFLASLITWLLIISPIFIWDHYLLSNPTGLWLSWWGLVILMSDSRSQKSDRQMTQLAAGQIQSSRV